MSIKIRCSQCSKKITIDEAFAGGICRCPYCKSLVDVPADEEEHAASARPAAPNRQAGRPAAPSSKEAASREKRAAAAHHEEIPMANPVKFQGIMAIVLLGLFLVMLIAGVIISVEVFWPEAEAPAPPPEPPNPYQKTRQVQGPVVAGDIELATPVVYCIDTGASMAEYYGYAQLMVESSLESLDGGRFSIILAGETEDKFVSGDYLTAHKEGLDKAGEFMQMAWCSGASDISRALEAALGKKPASVVLMARKEVDGAEKTAEKFKSAGVPLVVVALSEDAEVQDSLKKLAQAAGGSFRAYGKARLDQWARENTSR